MDSALRFHPLVADDLRSATNWYDKIDIGLGNRFRKAVNTQFNLVEGSPLIFGKAQGEIRACRVAGFPYLVLFVAGKSATEIVGVIHAASDSAKWQARLK